MTARTIPGEFKRSCRRCGWAGVYRSAAMGDFAKRQHSCEKNLRVAARIARGEAIRSAVDRTPRPCHHKQVVHEHGTYVCYVLDRCRCAPCAEARSDWESNDRRQKAYGRWDNLVDAGPARAHIEALAEQGMGLKRVVAVSDVTHGQLWKLIYGKRQADGTRVPSKRIRKDTEARILAVTLDLADGARVPSHGTRRRLQALVCLGYSQAILGQRIGMLPGNFGNMLHHRGEVLKSTAEAVAELYDELSMTPRVGTDQRSRISVSRAKRHAAHMMWLPPLAWDDETIDDPFSEPAPADSEVPHTQAEVDEVAVQRALDGDRVRLTKPDRVEVVRRWIADGRPLSHLEEQLGIRAERYIDKESA